MPSSACPQRTGTDPLSLHDALPIWVRMGPPSSSPDGVNRVVRTVVPATSSCGFGSLLIPSSGGRTRISRSRCRSRTRTRPSARTFGDRKSTRLNSSHRTISYAVFCLSAAHGNRPPFPTRRSSDLGKDGATIKLAGRGEPGGPNGRPGDLFVRVRVAPHPVFGRKDSDLTIEVPVTYADAALGANVRRSEEHTSELQSPYDLVCRLLLVRSAREPTPFPYTTLFRSG